LQFAGAAANMQTGYAKPSSENSRPKAHLGRNLEPLLSTYRGSFSNALPPL
jgi:hypothetical protein